MSRRVEGKTAIVTGAAQGIGKAIAIALAEGGANVAISDIQVAAGEALAERLKRSGCRVVFVRADVESEDDCSNLVKQSVECFSKLDVLVNNAGYFPRIS